MHLCWDTPSENTGLYQLLNMPVPLILVKELQKKINPTQHYLFNHQIRHHN